MSGKMGRVACFSAVVAVAIAVHVGSWRPNHEAPDTPSYRAPGENFVSGRGFVAPDRAAFLFPEFSERTAVRPDTIRTPVYPVLLALGERFAPGVPVIVLLQLAIHVLVTIWILLAMWRISGTVAAVTSSLYFALWPPALEFANELLTETLFLGLVVSAVVVLDRWARHRFASMTLLASAGLITGTAVLTRPIAVLYFVPVAIWVGWRSRRMSAVIVFTVAAVLLPTLWTARNHHVSGVTTLSSVLEENVLFFRGAGAALAAERPFEYGLFAHQRQNDFHLRMVRMRRGLFDRALDRIRSDGLDPYELNHAKRAQYYARDGAALMRSNPTGFLLQSVSGAIHLLFDDLWELAARSGWHYSKAKLVFYPVALARFACVVAGFVILIRRRESLGELALITATYFVGVSSGPESGFRYFVPVVPFVAIAIGAATDAMVRTNRAREPLPEPK